MSFPPSLGELTLFPVISPPRGEEDRRDAFEPNIFYFTYGPMDMETFLEKKISSSVSSLVNGLLFTVQRVPSLPS